MQKTNSVVRAWQRVGSVRPVFRAVVLVAAVAVVATGVTYAVLQSQNATLTGNSISTGNADLRIGTTASTFYPSRTGFSFSNIIPGAQPASNEGSTIYLKNYGTAPLNLRLYIAGTPVNTAGVDLSKTYLNITRTDNEGSGVTQKISIALLVAGAPTGSPLDGTLAAGKVAQYKLQVSMDEDAITSQTATVSGLDFVFNGVSVGATATAQ